jgi:WD40 repeat protein
MCTPVFERQYDLATCSHDTCCTAHSYIACAQSSPDGRRIAYITYNGSMHLWDDVSSKNEHIFFQPSCGLAWSLAWSKNSEYIATSYDGGKMIVWNVAHKSKHKEIQSGPDTMLSICWSPNGELLCTKGFHQSIKLWDVESGQLIYTLLNDEECTFIIFSLDNTKVYAGIFQSSVSVWWTVTGEKLDLPQCRKWQINCMDWSPDGNCMVTGGDDSTVRLYDINNETDKLILTGHTNSITFVVWSSDGLKIASSSYDTTLRTWSAATGIQLFCTKSNLFFRHISWMYKDSCILCIHQERVVLVPTCLWTDRVHHVFSPATKRLVFLLICIKNRIDSRTRSSRSSKFSGIVIPLFIWLHIIQIFMM